MTLNEFIMEWEKNRNDRFVIHTPTLELYFEVANRLDQIRLDYFGKRDGFGFKKYIDMTMIDSTKPAWFHYRESTCLGNDQTYCSLKYAKKYNYKIYKIKV